MITIASTRFRAAGKTIAGEISRCYLVFVFISQLLCSPVFCTVFFLLERTRVRGTWQVMIGFDRHAFCQILWAALDQNPNQ